MVKADMLYQLDLRLQEITQKEIPFGGISLFVFGDLMQLRPVLGRFIFDEPIRIEYKTVHQANPRWQMFQSTILEKNHRQGKDKSYADLLNRLRINCHTEEDLETLETRIQKNDEIDYKNIDLFIGGKLKPCAKLNENYIFKEIPGKLYKIKSVNFDSSRKDFSPKINEKDGSVGTTPFQDILCLKIGAKIIVIHNVDTLDKITNGQLGVLVDFIQTKDDKIDKLVVKLKNESAGKINRKKHPLLASRYPDCVFIDRFSMQYNVRHKSGDIGFTATVVQFPVKVAFAVTAHKIQGASIPSPSKVVLDLNSTFEAAQCYVMLSRVQQLGKFLMMIKTIHNKSFSFCFKEFNFLCNFKKILLIMNLH